MLNMLKNKIINRYQNDGIVVVVWFQSQLRQLISRILFILSLSKCWSPLGIASKFFLGGGSIWTSFHISNIDISIGKLLTIFCSRLKVKNTDICYMLTSIVLYDYILKSKKSMKIVNIEGENLHIFWTTWVNNFFFMFRMISVGKEVSQFA